MSQENAKVIYENSKSNKDKSNWLCPECKRRPPAQMVTVRDKECYCIYCGGHLEYED